jgi:hypothetical protein
MGAKPSLPAPRVSFVHPKAVRALDLANAARSNADYYARKADEYRARIGLTQDENARIIHRNAADAAERTSGLHRDYSKLCFDCYDKLMVVALAHDIAEAAVKAATKEATEAEKALRYIQGCPPDYRGTVFRYIFMSIAVTFMMCHVFPYVMMILLFIVFGKQNCADTAELNAKKCVEDTKKKLEDAKKHDDITSEAARNVRDATMISDYYRQESVEVYIAYAQHSNKIMEAQHAATVDAAQPAAEAAANPAAQTAAQPATANPTAQPAAHRAAQPATAKPAAQPATAKPTAQPAAQRAAQPAAAKPIAQPAAQPAAAKPIAQPAAQPDAEAVNEHPLKQRCNGSAQSASKRQKLHV